MQTNNFFTFGVVLLSVLAFSCGGTEKVKNSANTANTTNSVSTETKKSSAQAVTPSIQKVVIKSGATVDAIVKLKISEGFHINANPPSEPNLIPTEIKLEPQEGISAGNIVYPKGEPKSFTFSEGKKISVYQGEVEIKVPLKAERTAAKGEKTLKAKLRVQPCDDEVCYPPKNLDLEIPATIE